MKEIKKIITILVGLMIFYLAYCFWFGSGIFNGLFTPSVESGQLSAGPADRLSQLLELVATVITTVGTIGIFIASKLIKVLAEPFEGLVGSLTGAKEAAYVAHRVNVRGKPEGYDLYLKLLGKAAIDGKTDMCTAMLNEIHGEKFVLCVPSQLDSEDDELELTPGGFPKGGE